MARSRCWTTEKPMRFESSWAEGQRKGGQEERMADQLPAEEDLDRLATEKEFARLQRTTVLYYLHETNSDKWAGP
jgi:hypothetical protein